MALYSTNVVFECFTLPCNYIHDMTPSSCAVKLRHPPMQEDVKQWLRRLQCEVHT